MRHDATRNSLVNSEFVPASNDLWDPGWERNPPWFPGCGAREQYSFDIVHGARRIVACLDERHAQVLELRLGLGSHEPMTLQQVGEEFGVSRERIRQLQVRALTRLPSLARRAGILNDERADLTRQSGLAWLRGLRQTERVEQIERTFPGADVRLVAALLNLICGLHAATIEQWFEFERLRAAQQRHQERANIDIEKISANACDSAPQLGGEQFPTTPKREPDTKQHSFWSQKLSRSIAADSAFELGFLERLDMSQQVVDFCEQPLAISYLFQGLERRYFPDVAIKLVDGRCTVVEVKPLMFWADSINLEKWSAAQQWCSTRGWGFLVWDKQVTSSSFPLKPWIAEGAVLKKLVGSGWVDLRQGWLSEGLALTSLVPAALVHGFAFEKKPFRLIRKPAGSWLKASPPHDNTHDH